MSVVRVVEKHGSRSGPNTQKGGKRTASRTFVVQVSSPHDDGVVAY